MMIKSSSVRCLFVSAVMVGAIGAGVVATSGTAVASPHDSPSPSDRGDRTGWDHIDPQGFHHSATDPLDVAEQQNARREYFNQRPATETPRSTNNGNNGSTTWSSVRNEDGNWVVCRPQARSCR